MSLERVIAEQQKKIDHLELLVKSQRDQNTMLNQSIEKRFRQLDQLVSLRLRNCWKDDKKAQWEAYCSMIHDVKISMMEYGWCFNCRSFLCDCQHDYE